MNKNKIIEIKERKDAEKITEFLEKKEIPFDYQSPYELIHSRKVSEKTRRIPRFALLGGIAGFAGTFFFQYWAGTSYYPLNIGNKPFFSIITALPYAFEIAVLFAVISAFISFISLVKHQDKKALPQKAGTIIFEIEKNHFDELINFCSNNSITYDISEISR
jgi:hypothetical protein